MRKSNFYVAYVAVNLVGFILLVVYSFSNTESAKERLAEKGRLVRELSITDLCLFTEARYTRHITQADLHTPFQDHPMSIEHFPSGSLVLPPYWLRMEQHEVD